MKNYKIYILIALVGFLFASCSDMLDITPKGYKIPTTLEDFRALQTKAYDAFPNNSLLCLRTDETILKDDGYNFTSLEDIYSWNDETPSSLTKEMPWQSYYSTLVYTNEIIAEYVNIKKGDKNEINQLLGEAYALRALVNFNLMSLYSKKYNKTTAANDIAAPIATIINVEQDFYPSTVGKMYNQIVSDIAEAEKLLIEEVPLAERMYAFSKQSLTAFKSRFYLYTDDFVNAKKYALEVIKDKNISDIIEDYNNADSKTATDYNSKENLLALSVHFSGALKWDVYASEELKALYIKDKDLRYSKYFSSSDNAQVQKGYNNKDRCSFRYSEILLTLAESELKISKNVNEARKYLLQLLKNRLKPDFYLTEETRLNAITSDELMFKEVMKERAREFAFEGHRWFDLKRTTKPEIIHKIGEKTYKLKENDPRYVLPFPKTAIQNNPNLIK